MRNAQQKNKLLKKDMSPSSKSVCVYETAYGMLCLLE